MAIRRLRRRNEHSHVAGNFQCARRNVVAHGQIDYQYGSWCGNRSLGYPIDAISRHRHGFEHSTVYLLSPCSLAGSRERDHHASLALRPSGSRSRALQHIAKSRRGDEEVQQALYGVLSQLEPEDVSRGGEWGYDRYLAKSSPANIISSADLQRSGRWSCKCLACGTWVGGSWEGRAGVQG